MFSGTAAPIFMRSSVISVGHCYLLYDISSIISGVARGGLGGRCAHPRKICEKIFEKEKEKGGERNGKGEKERRKGKWEKEKEEKERKEERELKRRRKTFFNYEEILNACPPTTEELATPRLQCLYMPNFISGT